MLDDVSKMISNLNISLVIQAEHKKFGTLTCNLGRHNSFSNK
jgi:hypothetical protein